MKSALRRLRIFAKQLAAIEPVVCCDRVDPLEFHDNELGGWFIVPGLLDGTSIVVDVGLGEDLSFSESLIAMYGCEVYGFDPTPRAIPYVKACANSGLRLLEYGIGASSSRVRFFLPKTPGHVSGSIAWEEHLALNAIDVELLSIGALLRMLDADHVDLRKMDGEGAEYDVIQSPEFVALAPRGGQLCAEFHRRWKSRRKASTLQLVRSLRKFGFVQVWRSPTTNEEVTFLSTRVRACANGR